MRRYQKDPIFGFGGERKRETTRQMIDRVLGVPKTLDRSTSSSCARPNLRYPKARPKYLSRRPDDHLARTVLRWPAATASCQLLLAFQGTEKSARSQLSQEKSMRMILTASLLLLSSFAAVGQTQQPTAADSSETRNNAPERHHNYGWIGLIGLAGLVGLRRQRSVEHQRMAASGIKVKTVDAT